MKRDLFFSCDYKYFYYYLIKKQLVSLDWQKVEFDAKINSLDDLLAKTQLKTLFGPKRYFVFRNFNHLKLTTKNLNKISQISLQVPIFFLVVDPSILLLNSSIYAFSKLDSFNCHSLVMLDNKLPSGVLVDTSLGLDFLLDDCNLKVSSEDDYVKLQNYLFTQCDFFTMQTIFQKIAFEHNELTYQRFLDYGGNDTAGSLIVKLDGIELELIKKVINQSNSISLNDYLAWFMQLTKDYSIFYILSYLLKTYHYLYVYTILQANHKSSEVQRNNFIDLFQTSANHYYFLKVKYDNLVMLERYVSHFNLGLILKAIILKLTVLEQDLKKSNLRINVLIKQCLTDIYEILIAKKR